MKFNLEEFFTTIVLEDDTENHKPYPDPLFKYMELTGADKDSCIYIGDMTTDIQCANNAGVISGLVAWNNSGVSYSNSISLPDFSAFFHLYIIHSPTLNH